MNQDQSRTRIANQEFELIDDLLPKTLARLDEIGNKKLYKSYKYVYFIHYFTNRFELRKFTNDEYFKVSISFCNEAYISMMLNQKNASLLLLRSSIENFIKFMLNYYGLDIDPTRFKTNKGTLQKSGLLTTDLNSKLDRLLSFYNDFSGLSHSATNINTDIIEFLNLATTLRPTNFNKNYCSFTKIMKIYIYFIISICSESLIKWDTADLKNSLSIIFSDYETIQIISEIKDNE
ncbi:hypothetical protein [Loigolactobacillus binensis]|uniref:Uncharacterized protein n=1 Tax=Loigolactobacillus binensis TaxID=2559922 RepID=A0ABW3EAP8_9LACO|nr:hypothetical protein [Loigolactobacillus binensis]